MKFVRGRVHQVLRVLPLLSILISFLLTSCSHAPRAITIEQREQLESMEGYLPITPDSVAERYQRYDPEMFYARFGKVLARAVALVDSLNAGLPDGAWVDTIAIDHTFDNFGVAALQGRKISISSSHFYVDEKPEVIRSILFHEFGHLYYRFLPPARKARLDTLWQSLRATALFFILRDGEYSGNSWFGGHPEEGPAELFASAFNLFHNRDEEIYQRIAFHPAAARRLIDELKEVVLAGK